MRKKLIKKITAVVASLALIVTGLVTIPDTVNAAGLTTYGEVDYSLVYDYDYYIAHNPDVKAAFGANQQATLGHFVTFGMREGRQASPNFNVGTYKSGYADLQRAFGGNLQSYYLHYITNGHREGRKATGTPAQATPSIGSYSLVYDYNYYINKYADLKAAFGTNQTAAFNHFVNHGMSEGRQASPNFNVSVYKANYVDLQRAFGNNLRAYYDHYVNHGNKERRNAVSSVNNNTGNTENTSSVNSGTGSNSNVVTGNPSVPNNTIKSECGINGHSWFLRKSEITKIIELGEYNLPGTICYGCMKTFSRDQYEDTAAACRQHMVATGCNKITGQGAWQGSVDPSTVEWHQWDYCTKCGVTRNDQTTIKQHWFEKTEYADRYHLKRDIPGLKDYSYCL